METTNSIRPCFEIGRNVESTSPLALCCKNATPNVSTDYDVCHHASRDPLPVHLCGWQWRRMCVGWRDWGHMYLFGES